MISETTFIGALDEWLKGVRAEAIAQFRDGIPQEHCVPIALKITEARTQAKLQRAAQFGARGID